MNINSWIGTILGLVALVLKFVAAQFPISTELVYSRIIFPKIRLVMDYSMGMLPFPAFYLILTGALTLAIFSFRVWWRIEGTRQKAWFFFRTFCNTIGLVVFFFLVLWGYNYNRIPVFQQLSIHATPLTGEDLIQEMNYTLELLSAHRNRMNDTDWQSRLTYWELHEKISEEMEQALPRVGLRFDGQPKVKQFFPTGFMRRMGIYGIYFPFSGEGYLDPSLHALEMPFTLAHEMAHSSGITDEGEANFISWMVCSGSKDPFLRYAGEIKLLRYQLDDLYRIDPVAYADFVEEINEEIRMDLRSIRENILSIRPLFLAISKKSNDLYLKSQGVKAGIQSYKQLPMLAQAWRKRNANDFDKEIL